MNLIHQIGNYRFELAEIAPERRITPACSALEGAIAACNEFAALKVRIAADTHLTPEGKAARLEPGTKTMWSAVLSAAAVASNERANLDAREAKLYDVGTATAPHEIAADREVRDVWRAMPTGNRAKLLRDIEKGPRHAALVTALLRSPFPLALDLELTYLSDLHKQTRRLDNAGEWAAIEAGRVSIEWARAGIGHVFGISQNLTGWSRVLIAEHGVTISNKSGLIEMGFDPGEIGRAEVILGARAKLAA